MYKKNQPLLTTGMALLNGDSDRYKMNLSNVENNIDKVNSKIFNLDAQLAHRLSLSKLITKSDLEDLLQKLGVAISDNLPA